MILGRKSDEERSAQVAAKEADRVAKARAKALDQDQKRLRGETEQREHRRQAFLQTPAGQARTAFERGDHLFQFVMDVKNTQAVVIAMVGASTTSTTADPVAILNSVCHEGWDLVNGSFVFHELGSESRDKFLASGQNIAVKGTIIGYYLFRRCQANRVEFRDPWDVPAIERVCPICGVQMDAAARVCSGCQEDSDPWEFRNGFWWRAVDGDWHYLDATTGQWQKHRASASPSEGG